MKHTIFAGFSAAPLVVAAFLTTLLSSTSLFAAPTDADANKTIDSAINTQYASADIAKAEKTLLELIAACSNHCLAPTVARAWMYVGIVRGSGKDDLAGAQKAFATAKKTDPNVKLDELFATELVKRVFQQTTAGGADNMPLMGELQARAGEVEAVSAITCTLNVTDVETERPIPFACRAPANTMRMLLTYKHESVVRWHELTMTQSKGYWITEIPCTETKALGVMAYRIQALDAQGQPVDSLGTEQDPREINLVDQTSAAPPTLPDTPAPESCRPKKVVETTKGPLLGGYGQACSSESQCQGGLACVDGKCSADISCESDSDCASGTCDDGLCNVSAEECEGAACSKVPKNWISLSGGMDFAMMSGSQVCDVGSTQPDREAFSCFENGEPYQGRTNHNLGGDIDSGFRPATIRVLVGYERVLLPFFTVEARLGFAFNGGPESKAPAGDGSSFLPIHAEARAKLYFSQVFRDDARGLRGLSGYVSLGGGVAQVDPKVTVPVGECVPPPRTLSITMEQAQCIDSDNQAVTTKDLEVYKRLGQSFVSGGPGLRYGITKSISANLQLTGMLLLPSTGFALTPSLGVAAGF